MKRSLRKIFSATAVAGLGLTLLVLLADWAGLLQGIELWLYDQRVARCQYFMPPPTDRLIHVDIDDAALESIQKWPWDRSIMAKIMDELALAQPAAVALDVMFPEAQKVEWIKRPDGTFEQIDHDAMFAKALKNLGTGIVPASFSFPTQRIAPLFSAVRDVLVENLELGPQAVAAALQKQGCNDVNLDEGVRDDSIFLTARRAAMYARIERELTQADLNDDALRARVLPGVSRSVQSPLTRLLATQAASARAAIALRNLVPRQAPSKTAAIFDAQLAIAPLASLVGASSSTGFVDHPQSVDGRVRAIPLVISSENHVYPQLGLSLACKTMGVSLQDIRIDRNWISIPRPGQTPLSIPTRTLDPDELGGIIDPIPQAMNLAWFGSADWQTMYAGKDRPAGNQHLPIVRIWDAIRTRERMVENNRTTDAALLGFFEASENTEKLKWLQSQSFAPENWLMRLIIVKEAIGENGPVAEMIEQTDAKDRDQKSQQFLSTFRALDAYQKEAPLLAEQLERERKFLSDTLKGRAALVGWIASGAMDFVPTPLHAKCPGVVVHGVVFNSIMTGEVWRALPRWMTLLTTLWVGIVATLVVTHFTPAKALASSLLLILLYVVLNGIVLFDYGNTILGAAGPLTAIGLVWSGGTLTRLILEQRQRALIRRRFRTYVDPRLVDYVEKHPGHSGFEGERREMTVVFTDLVGFTTLTEVMGEDTVKVLNRLWAKMVPVVRRQGYLNKFLGDGIMFFYGAPEVSHDHAQAAVHTILEMRDVMSDFNAETRKEGLPELGMRFGVSTGDMIVGDAGAGEAGSDYTVLGDNVNLGARLEGANKATGTSNCVTERTAELAKDQFLFRPIGKLRVVGKQNGVMCYEALCSLDAATDQRKKHVAMTAAMVEAYQQQRLQDCIDAANQLDAEFGPSKLAALHRKLAEKFLTDPGDEAFDGLITLTEK